MGRNYKLDVIDGHVIFHLGSPLEFCYIINEHRIWYVRIPNISSEALTSIPSNIMNDNHLSIYSRETIFKFIFNRVPFSKPEVDALPEWFIEEYILRSLEE